MGEGLACKTSPPFGYALVQFALVSSLCASLDAAGQPLQKKVLKEYKARILKVVAVYQIYRKLCDENVIDETVERDITNSRNVDEARGCLFDHMMNYGNLEVSKSSVM